MADKVRPSPVGNSGTHTNAGSDFFSLLPTGDEAHDVEARPEPRMGKRRPNECLFLYPPTEMVSPLRRTCALLLICIAHFFGVSGFCWSSRVFLEAYAPWAAPFSGLALFILGLVCLREYGISA